MTTCDATIEAVERDIAESVARIQSSKFILVFAIRESSGAYFFHAALEGAVLDDARDIADAADHLLTLAGEHERQEAAAGRTRRPVMIETLQSYDLG